MRGWPLAPLCLQPLHLLPVLLDGILNPGVHHGLSEDPVLRGICHGLAKKRVLTQGTKGAARTGKGPGLRLPGDLVRAHQSPGTTQPVGQPLPCCHLPPSLKTCPHPTEPKALLRAGRAGAKSRMFPWAGAQTQEGPGLSAGHTCRQTWQRHTP